MIEIARWTLVGYKTDYLRTPLVFVYYNSAKNFVLFIAFWVKARTDFQKKTIEGFVVQLFVDLSLNNVGRKIKTDGRHVLPIAVMSETQEARGAALC